MKSLIVGASGQLGHAISSLLGDDRVLTASRRGAPSYELRIDLTEFATRTKLAYELIQQYEPDAVYCIGGMTDVDACESDRKAAMLTNCHGPAILAKVAATFGLPFIYISSDYVFDGKCGPYAEDAAPNPVSIYGCSKWQGELGIQAVHPKALIVRTTVVYGPDKGGKNFVYRLCRCLQRQQPIRVPCDQISTPTYCEDLARGVIALVASGAAGVYHVSGPETLSRLEFAIKTAEALQLDSSIIIGIPSSKLAQKAKRPLQGGLKTDKLCKEFPATIMRGVEESVCAWKIHNDAEWRRPWNTR